MAFAAFFENSDQAPSYTLIEPLHFVLCAAASRNDAITPLPQLKIIGASKFTPAFLKIALISDLSRMKPSWISDVMGMFTLPGMFPAVKASLGLPSMILYSLFPSKSALICS